MDNPRGENISKNSQWVFCTCHSMYWWKREREKPALERKRQGNEQPSAEQDFIHFCQGERGQP